MKREERTIAGWLCGYDFLTSREAAEKALAAGKVVDPLWIIREIEVPGEQDVSLLSEAAKDVEAMEWLDQNVFHRPMDDWDCERRPNQAMWVFFAPKGHHGTGRHIVRAAVEAEMAKM